MKVYLLKVKKHKIELVLLLQHLLCVDIDGV